MNKLLKTVTLFLVTLAAGCGSQDDNIFHKGTGPVGQAGPAGKAGANGKDGKDGIDGAAGTQGPAGTNGATGPAGTDGVPGVAGERGIQGEAGPQGPAGSKGETGEAGDVGLPGVDGIAGNDGTDGEDGTAGTSVVLTSVSITIDRSLPWGTSNSKLFTGLLFIPAVITVDGITGNLNGGGWLDIVIDGTTVLCFQRKSGTRSFYYSYTKSAGALLGCDSNSEKNNGATFGNSYLIINSIQFIPRDPKFSGILPTIILNGLKEEDGV